MGIRPAANDLDPARLQCCGEPPGVGDHLPAVGLELGPQGLAEAHRLLRPHGTLYVHLDYREVHYVKVLLDALFGRIPARLSYLTVAGGATFSTLTGSTMANTAMLGSMMVSWINVTFYQDLMEAMRKAIAEDRFAAWAEETKARLSAGTGTFTRPVPPRPRDADRVGR